MRTKSTLESILLAITILSSAGASTLVATEPATLTEVRQTLKQARVAELPSVASRLVSQSPASVKATNAVTVVKAAIQVAPGATLSVVSAVCKAAPEAAAAVVATAIDLQPKLRSGITVAAMEAAPAYRDAIVTAYRNQVATDSAASQTAANGTPASAGTLGDIQPAGINVRITPLPPPPTPPAEYNSATVEPYLGRRDYSRP